MYKKAIDNFGNAKNWYTDNWKYLQNTYDNPYLMARLLSAISPQMSVKKSCIIAMRIYDQHTNNAFIDYSGLMPCHMANVERALKGQELSGQKVRAFYQNLIGNLEEVTIDTWMIRFFKVEWKWVTPNRYTDLANRIKKYAVKAGLKPAELQAICWTYARHKAGFKQVKINEAIESLELLPI